VAESPAVSFQLLVRAMTSQADDVLSLSIEPLVSRRRPRGSQGPISTCPSETSRGSSPCVAVPRTTPVGQLRLKLDPFTFDASSQIFPISARRMPDGSCRTAGEFLAQHLAAPILVL
jgi:hypothetical protein